VAKPIVSLTADKGFIDDPFALDAAAGGLAVLRTDSASFARVDVVDLATGKVVRPIPLGDPHPIFERLLFAGGDGLVVIVRDPTSGKRSAQLFGPDGKPRLLVGPYSDIGITERGGERLLLGWERTTNGAGDTVHTVVRHRLAGLGRIGKPVVHVVTKAGDLKGQPFKVLGWLDAYSRFVGVRPGAFDKKSDLRLPDRAAVFDLLDGRLSWEADIADLQGWAAANLLRARRPQRAVHVVLAEDTGEIGLVDHQGRRAVMTLPVPLRLYDPASLQEQEDGPDAVTFSLGIDPLNPDALERRKKDTPFLDLYRARLEGPAGPGAPRAFVAHVLRAPLDDHPVAWAAQGDVVAVLRKHQAFSRGGTRLDVFRVR
jgi:hypothetical protein